MESFEGITILATNLRDNMDEAFTRRLHYLIELPFPDRDCRRRIWEVGFPPGAPLGELDIAFLASLKLSGGEIKNIGMTAATFAAELGEPIGMRHIMPALVRELEKMGKPVVAADLHPYQDLAEPLFFEQIRGSGL